MQRGRMILIAVVIITLLAFSAGAGFLVTHPGALNRLGMNLHASFFPPPPPVCGDGNCEGKDPYQTHCNTASGPGQDDAAFVANEVGVYDYFGRKLLVVQNWYSPKCQTNWALAYLMYPDEWVSLSIRSIDGQGNVYEYCNETYVCHWPDPEVFHYLSIAIPTQPIYTLMTVAPAGITACATGIASSPFDIYSGLSPDLFYTGKACA